MTDSGYSGDGSRGTRLGTREWTANLSRRGVIALGGVKSSFFTRENWFVIGATLLLALLVLIVLAGPYVLRDPNAQDLSNAFAGPGSSGYFLGADELGRDQFARILAGARTTLSIALVADLIVLLVGVFIGTSAALLGGKFEELIMRFVDIVYSLPGLLVTLIVVFILGPSARSVVIALSVDGWIVFARLTHGMTKALRRSAFIESAHVSRCSTWWVVKKHVLPHLVSPILTVATLELARLALAESTLSFLGLGVQPPTVSLGMLLQAGENNMSVAWWLITFPGVYLVLFILSINILAGYIRMVTDPLQVGR